MSKLQTLIDQVTKNIAPTNRRGAAFGMNYALNNDEMIEAAGLMRKFEPGKKINEGFCIQFAITGLSQDQYEKIMETIKSLQKP